MYEFELGAFKHLANDDVFGSFQKQGFEEQLYLYRKHKDAAYLWRAWRIARIAGELPTWAVELIAPHFDAIASTAATGTRLTESRTRHEFVVAYFYMLEHHRDRKGNLVKRNISLAERYRRTAKAFRTSPPAIKQMILEHEGRGQRGRNR